jgi:peptidoglycan/xylan/chitin deacetylase (PgdA/CDA1 family)
MPRLGALAQSFTGAAAMQWLLQLPLWRGALVLGYHRVLEPGTENPFDDGVVSATPATLDAQLRLITRSFEVVTPDALESRLGPPGRKVVLTFDDGYRDNFELALPVLRRHGVRATFFLTTGFLDRPRVPWWDELAWMVKHSRSPAVEPNGWLPAPLALEDHGRAIAELAGIYKRLPTARTHAYLEFCARQTGAGRCPEAAADQLWMTWDMAEEMRSAGMLIGGHSANHPVLGRSDEAQQRHEIEGCARHLRDRLGVSMRWFAYPVGLAGTYDDVTRRLLRAAGVRLAFSLRGGFVPPGPLDPLDVPRASVALQAGESAFRAALAQPRLFARW